MKNIIGKKYSRIMLLFVILCFLFIPSLTFAQKLTHVVQKGDTLWGICEQYYGDPNLWPKLWEMNPFITNPHLLKAGDVITLFEKEPVKEVKKIEVKEEKPPVAVTVEKPPVKEETPVPAVKGIDIGSLTELDTIGFLSREKLQPWGSIFASESDRLMLVKGETAYVIFDENREIKTGDQYLIGKSSSSLKHPITGKHLGYAFDVSGILTIEERLGNARKGDKYFEKKNVFKAVINESYKPVSVDDILMPYKPVSSCILPVPSDKKIVANIVAAKNQTELIHSNSVVYVDLGLKDDLKPGNILNVIKANVVPDPNPDEKFFTLWKSKIILPDIFVGRIMIIECGPEFSTAIVLSSVESFSKGAFIKELSWEKNPDFLSEMASCPIK
jgi:hypothetical protein